MGKLHGTPTGKQMAGAFLPAFLILAGAGWAASPMQAPAARFVHYLRAAGCDRHTGGEQLTLRERLVYAYILASS